MVKLSAILALKLSAEYFILLIRRLRQGSALSVVKNYLNIFMYHHECIIFANFFGKSGEMIIILAFLIGGTAK